MVIRRVSCTEETPPLTPWSWVVQQNTRYNYYTPCRLDYQLQSPAVKGRQEATVMQWIARPPRLLVRRRWHHRGVHAPHRRGHAESRERARSRCLLRCRVNASSCSPPLSSHCRPLIPPRSESITQDEKSADWLWKGWRSERSCSEYLN